MRLAQEKLERLAVWAQDYILLLEQQVAEKDKRIADLSEGDPASDTWVENYGEHSGMSPDIPLGVGAMIRFQVKQAKGLRKYPGIIHGKILVRERERVLELQGGTALTVRPRSTNLLWITLEDR